MTALAGRARDGTGLDYKAFKRLNNKKERQAGRKELQEQESKAEEKKKDVLGRSGGSSQSSQDTGEGRRKGRNNQKGYSYRSSGGGGEGGGKCERGCQGALETSDYGDDFAAAGGKRDRIEVGPFMQVLDPEPRLCCTTCSLLGKLRYPPGPLVLPTNPNRIQQQEPLYPLHSPDSLQRFFPLSLPRSPVRSKDPTSVARSGASLPVSSSSPSTSPFVSTSDSSREFTCHIDRLLEDVAVRVRLNDGTRHKKPRQIGAANANRGPSHRGQGDTGRSCTYTDSNTDDSYDLRDRDGYGQANSNIQPRQDDARRNSLQRGNPSPTRTINPPQESYTSSPGLSVSVFKASDTGFGIRILHCEDFQSDSLESSSGSNSQTSSKQKGGTRSRSGSILSDFNMPVKCESPSLDHMHRIQ